MFTELQNIFFEAFLLDEEFLQLNAGPKFENTDSGISSSIPNVPYASGSDTDDSDFTASDSYGSGYDSTSSDVSTRRTKKQRSSFAKGDETLASGDEGVVESGKRKRRRKHKKKSKGKAREELNEEAAGKKEDEEEDGDDDEGVGTRLRRRREGKRER